MFSNDNKPTSSPFEVINKTFQQTLKNMSNSSSENVEEPEEERTYETSAKNQASSLIWLIKFDSFMRYPCTERNAM